jgi:hypothetical protein
VTNKERRPGPPTKIKNKSTPTTSSATTPTTTTTSTSTTTTTEKPTTTTQKAKVVEEQEQVLAESPKETPLSGKGDKSRTTPKEVDEVERDSVEDGAAETEYRGPFPLWATGPPPPQLSLSSSSSSSSSQTRKPIYVVRIRRPHSNERSKNKKNSYTHSLRRT